MNNTPDDINTINAETAQEEFNNVTLISDGYVY
jgi:hypothetical protein